MGSAFTIAHQLLEDREAIPSRAYRPALVLVSDGLPTDDGEEENILWLTPSDLRQLGEVLRPVRGRIEGPAQVVWVIEPTELKDRDGKVVEVIG